MNAPPRPLGAERSDGSAVQIGALVPLARPGWVEAGRHLLNLGDGLGRLPGLEAKACSRNLMPLRDVVLACS
jgi:hypothetical protein